jgi:hypothetical protein
MAGGARRLLIGGNQGTGLIDVPAAQSCGNRHHIDTIDRAGFNTQITAGALRSNHSVHQLGGTENGVDRTGLDALGTANALGFSNNGHGANSLYAVLGIERQDCHIEQIGKGHNSGFAAGWALINGFTGGNGRGIRPAAGMAALAALGLRQQVVYFIDNGIAFGLKADGRKTKQSSEDGRQQ